METQRKQNATAADVRKESGSRNRMLLPTPWEKNVSAPRPRIARSESNVNETHVVRFFKRVKCDRGKSVSAAHSTKLFFMT